MRDGAAAQCGCKRAAERDPVAFDGDVEVERRLVHEDVAHGAADEIDALERSGCGRGGLEHRHEPGAGAKLLGEVGDDDRRLGHGLLERAQHVAARHHADDRSLGDDRDAADVRLGDEPLRLGERGLLRAGDDGRRHDALHRRVREIVRDGLVQILARDDALELGRLADEDPALAVLLALDHRVRDRVVRRDEPRGVRHDLARGERPSHGARQRGEHERPRFVERSAIDGRGRLGVTAAAERAGERRGVELGHAGARDAEDPLPHLHERDEAARIGEVDELVDEVRDPVDVLGPGDRGDEHLEAAGVVRLDPGDERLEERALLRPQGRVQVLGDHVLARAVAQAPAERVGVALGHRRIRERARVLVDAEREHGRLERGRLDLALGEDPDERGRERAVLREDEVLLAQPVGPLGLVVIEDDHLDAGPQRDLLELTQALGVDGLDDDQALDRLVVDRSRVGDLELVGMQPEELADVAVHRPGQRGDRARIEAPCGERATRTRRSRCSCAW